MMACFRGLRVMQEVTGVVMCHRHTVNTSGHRLDSSSNQCLPDVEKKKKKRSPMRQVTVGIDSCEDEGLFLEALNFGAGGRWEGLLALSRFNL